MDSDLTPVFDQLGCDDKPVSRGVVRAPRDLRRVNEPSQLRGPAQTRRALRVHPRVQQRLRLLVFPVLVGSGGAERESRAQVREKRRLVARLGRRGPLGPAD